MRQYRGEFLVFASAFFFATTGVLGKLIISGGINPLRLTQIRTTGTFIALLLFVLLTNMRSLKIKRDELPNLMLIGIIGVAGVQSLYFFAVTRMPISITLVIEFTSPIWIALFIRFFRKQLVRPLMWWGIGVAISGLIMVTQIWDGWKLDALGVIATFIDALFLSFYYLRSEKTVRERSGLSMLVYAFGSATLFFAVIQPIWTFPTEIFSAQISLQELSADGFIAGWQLISILIAFGSILPYLLVTYGLKYIPASQGSVIAMTEPVIAGGIAWVVLGETLSAIQLLGGMTVLVGIYLTERARQSTDK